MNDYDRCSLGKQTNRKERSNYMTKQEKQASELLSDSLDREESPEEMEPLKDVSHTPPVGQGANRVWDGTRVFDGDTEDDE